MPPSFLWHLSKSQGAQLRGLNEPPHIYTQGGPRLTSCTEHTIVETVRAGAMMVLRQFLGQFLQSFQQASEPGTVSMPISQMGKLRHKEVLLGREPGHSA